jgi:hypothetical protein
MKNILIFTIILFIITIIFIKLYFSYNEEFATITPQTVYPNKKLLISELINLYGTTSNLNNELQIKKLEATSLPDNIEIESTLANIPNDLNNAIDKIKNYSNLLMTDPLNKDNIDNTYNNLFRISVDLFENNYVKLYSNIINYNSNIIKQNYDTAINNFKLSYDNYNTKLDLYNSIF